MPFYDISQLYFINLFFLHPFISLHSSNLCFLTSLGRDGVRLALVLSHHVVDEADDIRSNRCAEHRWQLQLRLGSLALLTVDGH